MHPLVAADLQKANSAAEVRGLPWFGDTGRGSCLVRHTHAFPWSGLPGGQYIYSLFDVSHPQHTAEEASVV